MKKVAIVKKQLGKLGYKLNSYAKNGKIVSMYFNKTGNYKQKLEVILSYEGEHIIYTPIGFCNYEFISSLKDLKLAVHSIEDKIIEHKKEMRELEDGFKECTKNLNLD